MSLTQTTDTAFEQDVLKASKPVLVDFWAEWCGPCKQIGPALEQISDELSGKVTIAKVNIDDSPMTPSKMGVKGIPTLMLFKDGQLASMKVGAMPKGKIVEWLAEAGVKVPPMPAGPDGPRRDCVPRPWRDTAPGRRLPSSRAGRHRPRAVRRCRC